MKKLNSSPFSRFVKTHLLEIGVLACCSLIFFGAIFYGHYVDDMDNMLGGKLILMGHFPYSGFFSHHLPGMYFISAPLYFISGDNLFTFRLLFNVVSYVLLFLTYVLIRNKISVLAGLAYVFVISITHIIALAAIPLAESLIALLIPLVFMLIYSEDKKISFRTVAFVSIALFSIPLLSLSFVFVCLVLYLYLLIKIIQARENLKNIAISAVILGLPYFIFLFLLILTNTYDTFVYDVLRFNTEIYAPMVNQTTGSIVEIFFQTILQSLKNIFSLITGERLLVWYSPAIILLGYIIALSLFIFRKKYLEAGVVLFILLTIDVGLNVFSKTAFLTPVNLLSHHNQPFMVTGLFLGLIAGWEYITSRKKSRFIIVGKVLSCLFILLVVSTALVICVQKYQQVTKPDSSDNFYTYTKLSRHSHVIDVSMAASANNSKKIWLGPLSFQDQILLDDKQATHFTFYLPWIDSSEKLRSAFMDELSNNPPDVIYFSPYNYNGNRYVYSSDLNNFLSDKYYSINDPKLANFFFNKTKKQQINQKLLQAQFID